MRGDDLALLALAFFLTAVGVGLFAFGLGLGRVQGLKRGIVLGVVILASGIAKKRDNDESR